MLPGLSPEQGPPFSAPLRYFLTAPLFLAAAGLLAALDPGWTTLPQSPTGLALTHLVTLGFLAMVMLGALTQMLPVLAGAPLPKVMAVTRVSHLGLTLGTPVLALGLATLTPLWLRAGAGLLGLALVVYLGAAGNALMRARGTTSVWVMRLSLVALVVTLCGGLGLDAWLTADWATTLVSELLRTHILFGLVGWIGLLIIASALQVVPMLQLTPAYPSVTIWVVTAGIALALLAMLLPPPWRDLGTALVSVCLASFALLTLRLLGQRKRKQADVTLDFWRVAMLCLGVVGLLGLFPEERLPTSLMGVLYVLGFAVSVVNGMLYKIVPFLAWFHLQAQRGWMASQPAMSDYLPQAAARGQLRVHLAALVGLLGASFAPPLAIPGGLLLAASALWLGSNLWTVARLFHSHGGRI